MKHKLLSLFALAGAMFMSTSVWAQKWQAPIKPTLNEVNADEVVSGKTYYFKNVGAGQFLAGGGSWATQAVFTWKGMDDDARQALRVIVADSTATIAKVSVKGVSLKLDGKFNTYGTSDRAAYSVSNTYIFRDNATNAFIDHNNQDRGYIWKITKADNGYYRIQTADGDPAYTNASSEYAGWDSTNGPIEVVMNEETQEEELSGTPSTQVTFNLAADDENAKIDWMLIEPGEYLEALKVYDVRKSLYETLLEGDEAGIAASVLDAATVVYENEAATIEEMNAQIAHIKAAISGLKYDFTGASEDNPLDVTDQVLVNPTFDTDIKGWTITVTGQNLQWQGRTDGKVDASKNWVQITNFIEAWRPSDQGGLGDGTISQTVYGLPKGKYMLECDAMATRQGGLNGLSAEEAVTGAYIFIEGEDEEVRNPIKAPDTQPKHWSVVFVCKGGDWLTFGLKAESTTANWLSADNFKLTYYGETNYTQGQLDLLAALEKADELEQNYDLDYSYVGTKEAYETAKEAAEALADDYSQEESVYVAAAEALSAAIEDMTASLQVYETLADFISDTGKLAEYEALTANNGWDDLSAELSEWQSELDDAYTSGSMTEEEVTKAVGSLKSKITDWLAEQIEAGSEAIQEGTDLTILLDNPSFDDGGNGWTISKDGGNSGTVSVDDGVDYHEFEFWRSKFDFYQTIANMPAGAYEITVQGFSRNEDDQLNPDANIKIELYAGDNTAKFMNLLDPKQRRLVEGNEPLWDGANPDRKFEIDGVEYYAPNGMGAASAYFATENPQTNEPFYTNHVLVTLKEAGDFTIGVRSYDKTEWTLFDNFRIKYRGSGGDIFAEMAQKKFEELTEVYESEANAPFVTQKAMEDYAAISLIGYDGVSSIDEYNAYAEPCDELIAYIKEGTKLIKDLNTLISEDYYARVLAVADEDYDMSEFSDEYITTYTSLLEKGSNFEDNDALRAIPAIIGAAWTEGIQDQAEDETFGNNTAVIYNANYTDYADATKYNLNGWTMEKNDTVTFGNYLANQTVAEVYNPKGEYTHYQTIYGLEPGFYRVTVDGYFRPGDAYDEEDPEAFKAIKRAYLFGESTAQTAKCPVKNVLEGAQEVKIGTGAEKEYKMGTDPETGLALSVFTPNDVTAAAAYFAGAIDPSPVLVDPLEGESLNVSVYRNTITLEVGEDGILTIGVSNVGNSYVTNDWACFGNWTLSYMGTECPDGVASVNAKVKNAPAVIYTIDGRQASRLQRGLNIVRNADGKVQKVMVK